MGKAKAQKKKVKQPLPKEEDDVPLPSVRKSDDPIPRKVIHNESLCSPLNYFK